jgi:hypothetical protein
MTQVVITVYLPWAGMADLADAADLKYGGSHCQRMVSVCFQRVESAGEFGKVQSKVTVELQ